MPNVKVSLAVQGFNVNKETLSDVDGHFFFSDVIPGPFQMTLTASGFANFKQSGVLHAGENFVVPQIALVVARANVDVEVTESQAQVAEDEVKVEEKQRVLGVIPNFYVSYLPHAAPAHPEAEIPACLEVNSESIYVRNHRRVSPELNRQKIHLADMDKERKAMPNVTAQPTLIW